MDIREAVLSILGESLGEAVIRNQGLEWAVEVARAKASDSENPLALDAINNTPKHAYSPQSPHRQRH